MPKISKVFTLKHFCPLLVFLTCVISTTFSITKTLAKLTTFCVCMSLRWHILCVYVCMYWCVCFAAVMANKDITYICAIAKMTARCALYKWIEWAVAEIWPFEIIQDGGMPPTWIWWPWKLYPRKQTWSVSDHSLRRYNHSRILGAYGTRI